MNARRSSLRVTHLPCDYVHEVTIEMLTGPGALEMRARSTSDDLEIDGREYGITAPSLIITQESQCAFSEFGMSSWKSRTPTMKSQSRPNVVRRAKALETVLRTVPMHHSESHCHLRERSWRRLPFVVRHFQFAPLKQDPAVSQRRAFEQMRPC